MAICATAGVGMVMLYSAAGGSAEPWAIKQLPRFVVALGMMLIVALSDIRLWLRWAYLIYFASLMLLVIVEFLVTSAWARSVGSISESSTCSPPK